MTTSTVHSEASTQGIPAAPYADPDCYRAEIERLRAKRDALPDDAAHREQRLLLRYAIAEQTQAWHMAVRRQRQKQAA
jgi:hypothetical protein